MSVNDSQQFCLRWNNYQSAVVCQVADLQDLGLLTDVTLTAEGRNLKAHRIVLSACSSYFKDLFKDLLISQHPVVIVQDATYEDLSALVSFMYKGEVQICQSQLPSLLRTAQILAVTGLGQVPPKSDDSSPPRIKSPHGVEIHTETSIPASQLQPAAHSSDPGVPSLIKPSYSPPSPPLLSVQVKKRRVEETYDRSYPVQGVISEGGEQANVEKEIPECQAIRRSDVEPLYSSLWNTLNERPSYDQSPLPVGLPGPFGLPSNSGPEDLSVRSSLKSPIYDLNKNKLSSPQGSTSTLCISSRNPSVASISCPVCFKMVSNQYNLRVHMDLHNENNYLCPLCRHKSRSKDALRKHLAYRHLLGPHERKSLEIATASSHHPIMSKEEMIHRMKTIQPGDVNPDPRQAHKNLNDNGNDSGQSNEESPNDECDVDP